MAEAAKRVLLTGGTGFVGANLARRLARDGHEVHLLVRPAENRWRLTAIEDQVRLHLARLEERALVEEVVSRVDPEWVFHLAAYGAYSSQRDVETIVTTNFNGTVHLVEACLNTGCEVLVNAGTSSEYGYQDHPPVESELPRPNSHYAVTKAAATLYCRFTAEVARRRLVTLRLYSVYGPWEEPTRFLPTLLVHARKGELPPLVTPQVARDFVYVDDAVEAFVLAATQPVEESGPVLNVATGIQTTVAEVVELVRARFALAVEPVWGSMPDRDWDTHTWVGDARAIDAALGWRPKWDLEAGLARFAEWMESDPVLVKHYETHRTPPS